MLIRARHGPFVGEQHQLLFVIKLFGSCRGEFLEHWGVVRRAVEAACASIHVNPWIALSQGDVLLLRAHHLAWCRGVGGTWRLDADGNFPDFRRASLQKLVVEEEASLRQMQNGFCAAFFANADHRGARLIYERWHDLVHGLM